MADSYSLLREVLHLCRFQRRNSTKNEIFASKAVHWPAEKVNIGIGCFSARYADVITFPGLFQEFSEN